MSPDQRAAVTGATIPNTVTKISNPGFANLTNLQNIVIPSSVTFIDRFVFQSDSSLLAITIPESVTDMADGVFGGCTALQSATILNSMISPNQFANCTSLKDVTISSNVTTIDGGAFTNCSSVETLTIPASVTSCSGAFGGMTGLKTLNFYAQDVPAVFGGLPIENLDLTGAETIATGAFTGCSKLKNVIMSNSLTSIGRWVFQNDTSLLAITIPESVTDIADAVFSGCTALQSATVLNSTINVSQFANCTSLKDVTISNNVTSIGGSAFANCSSVETLTIPASVTSCSGAFGGMTGLKTLNFYAQDVPGGTFNGFPIETLDLTGAETIAWSAFSDCLLLTNITMTNSLKSIARFAFQNCSSLQQITIPSSVTFIDVDAFGNCANLQDVTVRWDTPLVVGSTPFSNLNPRLIQLNVPEGTENAYLSANVWQSFNIIMGTIHQYSPDVLGNNGSASITIYGGRLTKDATVELIQNGTAIKAVSVTGGNPGEFVANFAFNQIPSGKYDLHIMQANSVDTLISGGITVQGIAYPSVTASLASSGFRNFPTTSYLVLHNSGNVDALGVNAHILAPQELQASIKRKSFRDVIDTTGVFNFYCPDFDVALSIPNSLIARYMDVLSTGDSIPVTTAFGAPFNGTAYQIYVPRVPSGGDVRIPITFVSHAGAHAISNVITAVDGNNTFNPVSSDSLNYLAVQRLNNYMDVYVGIQDSVMLQKITDFGVWQKTWKVAEEVERAVLAADRDHTGYSADQLNGTLDSTFFDYGIHRKEMATVMLALEGISTKYSSEQRPDGIMNFAGSGYQTASTYQPVFNAPQNVSKDSQATSASDILNNSTFQEIMSYNSTFSQGLKTGNGVISLYRMACVDNQDPNRQGLRFFTTATPDDQGRIIKIVYDAGGDDIIWGKVGDVMNFATPLGSAITPSLQAGITTLQAGLAVARKINQNYVDAGLEDIAPAGSIAGLNKFNQGLQTILPGDPNDITGPAGVNDERYVSSSQPMNYVIYFENKPDANVPAMFVNVYDTLDVNKYDMSTLRFNNIQVADTVFSMPGVSSGAYYNEYDLRPRQNYLLGVTAELNTETGIVHWRFETLDPATHATIDDPTGGFLPPNVNAPEGEASVSFSVKQKNNLPHLTQLANEATIVFDYNEPMTTNLWTNLLDITAPTSSVFTSQLSDSTFKVAWNGTDTESGTAGYTVYTSINNGDFFPMGTYANVNEMTLKADVDTLYSFYVEAVDNVGNAEQKPAIAEASIKLSPTAIPTVKDNQSSLWATVNSGILKIAGLEQGIPFSIYDLRGITVYKGIASASEASVSLPDHGVYIIQSGGRTVKVMN